MDLSIVPYVEDPPRSAAAAAEPAGCGVRRYRECMRNHAAAIGGRAYDGCGEFMPGGKHGTLEAFKCAVCGCHRNFHRRDGCGVSPALLRRPLLLAPLPSAFTPIPAPYIQIRPPAAAYDGGRAGSETPPRMEEAAGGRGRKRYRYRTRFTADQKEKMQAFAEKLGWRIQKHDDVALAEFCAEIGVKRHVLKVWMHNNKHAAAADSPKRNTSGGAVSASAGVSGDSRVAPPRMMVEGWQ